MCFAVKLVITAQPPEIIMRTRAIAAAICLTTAMAGLALAGTGGSATAMVTAKPTAVIAGSVASFASSARVVGAAPAIKRLSIQLWLRPRIAAATRFANAVSTPGDAQFRHFLSPNAWTARFGATVAAATTVESWLRTEGFTGVHTDAQRSYVRATAAISTINRAFDVEMMLYTSTPNVSAGPHALRS